MSTPTEADRETARALCKPYGEPGGLVNGLVELAIARALADEREKARAPFLALVAAWEDATRDWYYENRHTHPNGIEYVAGYEDGWDYAADQVRKASEGDQ